MNPLPADWTLNVVIWGVVWSALVALQVVTARSDRADSIGPIVQFVRRWWVGRWILLAAWVWLGWHLFVRTNY
jgi:hypothetical protein